MSCLKLFNSNAFLNTRIQLHAFLANQNKWEGLSDYSTKQLGLLLLENANECMQALNADVARENAALEKLRDRRKQQMAGKAQELMTKFKGVKAREIEAAEAEEYGSDDFTSWAKTMESLHDRIQEKEEALEELEDKVRDLLADADRLRTTSNDPENVRNSGVTARAETIFLKKVMKKGKSSTSAPQTKDEVALQKVQELYELKKDEEKTAKKIEKASRDTKKSREASSSFAEDLVLQLTKARIEMEKNNRSGSKKKNPLGAKAAAAVGVATGMVGRLASKTRGRGGYYSDMLDDEDEDDSDEDDAEEDAEVLTFSTRNATDDDDDDEENLSGKNGAGIFRTNPPVALGGGGNGDNIGNNFNKK
jgi:hypothetical protein